jgi:quinol-cytochrome oxidoreductase complex cytochrome b subunit
MGSLLIYRSEFQISHNLAISLALVFFLSVRMLQGRKEGRESFVAVLTQVAPRRKKERKKRKERKKAWYTRVQTGVTNVVFLFLFLFLFFFFLGGVVSGLDSRLPVSSLSH